MDDARNDAALVQASLEGEARAFGILVDRYQKAVFNAAYRLVGDTEEAKDICQSVFLKVHESLRSFNPSFAFCNWIHRITVNEAINVLKKKSRYRPLDDADDYPAPGVGPEKAAADTELGRYLQSALMTLKPEYRLVIVLRHLLAFSYSEIAEITQLPGKTVKSRLFTARQLLKERLIEKGVVR